MISAQSLSKNFDSVQALSKLNLKIKEGQVFGLIGSNGSGKSTLLRIIAGVYKQDSGKMLIDDQPAYDNPALKHKVFFLSDTAFFLNGSTLMEMALFYEQIYPDFSMERFYEMNKIFPINPAVAIGKMSKGMQRQAALILAFSARPKYLLLDEAFDGLDPVMRESLKRIIAKDVSSRNMTVIISSHNLRELEDMCDCIGLLHNGKIVYTDSIDSMKNYMHKIQVGFSSPKTKEDFDLKDIIHFDSIGSVISIVVKGDLSEISEKIKAMNPLFIDVLTPTLEQLFIYELGGLGYDVAEITE